MNVQNCQTGVQWAKCKILVCQHDPQDTLCSKGTKVRKGSYFGLYPPKTEEEVQWKMLL